MVKWDTPAANDFYTAKTTFHFARFSPFALFICGVFAQTVFRGDFYKNPILSPPPRSNATDPTAAPV